jgi:type VI secretion system secreted protein Hcp
MAFQAFVSIKGNKQGQFKGESTAVNRKDWIPVVAFTMGLTSPRDLATGQASGKRQFEPVTVVKEWGASSPQGLTACSNNEALTTVVFEFVKTDAAGKEVVGQKVTLTRAAVSRVLRSTADPGQALGSTSIPSGTNTKGFESWSFTFQKIVVEDEDGKTTYSDEWSAPAA